MASKQKSKGKSSQPVYAASPEWSDIQPIPLIDGPPDQPDPGPALATIAYSPRYSEAMSYLRAVMAKNEASQRALKLTEDIISMNPAHYTVWLYRMKILRTLWGDDGIQAGVQSELKWLEDVSEKNLKNYQIWHHRQTLVSLLPTLPADEISFVTHMLSFDSKNYHVWTYRQWLCRHFADPLLTTGSELISIDALISEDVRNNSAWSHRYFVCFGADELDHIEKNGGNRKAVLEAAGLVVDQDVVDREIQYTKDHIEWAPQNPSPWNYLKGVVKRAGIPPVELRAFCEEYVGSEKGLERFLSDDVRSSHAIDWLADIYGQTGETEMAKACLNALGDKWDPIRKNYWDYRVKQLE